MMQGFAILIIVAVLMAAVKDRHLCMLRQEIARLKGEPFDPELHEAMTMQPSAEAEPGSVLTVIQKGYRINGRLLRPARVIVARPLEE